MRFLADENVPHAIVMALRTRGIDIAEVRDIHGGASDMEVLDIAASQRRVLLTFDKDFGRLARAGHPSSPAGVVLLRLPLSSPNQIGQVVADVIMGRNDWEGRFAIVEPGRVRLRPL